MIDSDGSHGNVTGGPTPPAAIFDESTEFGRAMAAVDWASTGVGPWQEWPASLSNTVRLMLGSRFAMWMAWGPELTFFCNDDYRRDTLGAKYPWALGKPASLVWSEIWPDVSPRIDAVINTGVATWDEGLMLFLQRSGYPEETYHTFSYSPIHDDAGEVAGMLCVVSEDTARVISQRRIALLSNLGAALSGATTEAAVADAARTQIATDPYDAPFAIAYVLDDTGAARLHWATGVTVGSELAPPVITPTDRDLPWYRAIFGDDDSHLVSLAGLGAVPTGGWHEPPEQAIALPLAQTGVDTPYGFLIIALNPFREFDDDYRSFVDLITSQVAASIARAQAFETERDRVERLAELDRAKTTFFTNVSHELRTPLTLMLGPAEDALGDDAHALAPQQRHRIEIVQRNGERLLKLVNTLLDFSRLESGRVEASFEQLDLTRFTGELAGMFDSAYARSDLTLEIDCRPLAASTYVDREMWSKIVLNLVSNALKATFTGGVAVRLYDDTDGGGVRLDVTDTGVGIPASQLGHLFERFHRVAGAELRSHEGSGIGLALVAELVALHGGEVSVESELGAGSTFTVRIPYGRDHLPAGQVLDRVRSDAPDAVQYGIGYLSEALRWSAADNGVQAETGPSGRARVLVVDDNADMRDYVSELLREDYDVSTASDGNDALAQVGNGIPDLVLTDVMMPGLDGFGLLAALREDRRTMHVPVVMLSARSGDEATVEGLDAGADDYLVKPFSARELLARVRANLELDRVRRVLEELRRSQDILDNAEALAQIGSWELDLRTDQVRMSDEHIRMLGFDPEVTAVPLSVALATLSTQDQRLFTDAVQRAVTADGVLDLELHPVRTDGTSLIGRVHAVVVRDDEGSPTFLRGSIQDITAQRAAEIELAAAHADREVASREHAIAAELQQSLMPPLDLTSDVLDIAAFYRAGQEGTQVGGDWYDVITLGGGRTALVIGDVMGRGVRAAAVMGQLRAAIRAYARLDLGANDLVRLLDGIVDELSADTIVTCVYVIHDQTTGRLDYANAGHLPPLLTTPDGKTRRLVAGGPPLGAGHHGEISEYVEAPAGSILTLYTDGLVERRGTDIDDGIDRLAAMVSASTSPLAQLPGELTAELLEDEPDDDVALLMCRVGESGAARDVVEHTVTGQDDALANARREVARTLRRWDADDSVVFDAQVAVSELVTNAVRYGAPPITVRLLLHEHTVVLEVADAGTGSPAQRVSAPDEVSGRGLLIVSSLAIGWGVRETGRHKVVWCEFALQAEPGQAAG